MPRRRIPEPGNPIEAEERVSFGGEFTEAHHHRGELLDPLQPLPGGIKMVRGQRRKRTPAGDRAAAIALYRDYLDTLTACNGRRAEALSRVLGISIEAATREEHILHARMMDSLPQNATLSEMLKVYDLSREARLVVLRQHVYSPLPAASLKALDMLNELDANTGADTTGSYESYVRALAGRGAARA